MNLSKVLLIKPDVEYSCIATFNGIMEIGYIKRYTRNNGRSTFFFNDDIELFSSQDDTVMYLHHQLEELTLLESVYSVMCDTKPSKLCIKYITDVFMTHDYTKICLSHLAVKWYKEYPILMQWVLKLIHDNIISDITTLQYLIAFKNDNGHLSQFLQRKTLTAYNTEEDIVNLISEIKSIKQRKKSLSIIKQFNTQQRVLLSKENFTKKQSLLLFKFDVLNKDLKINFIKKVSNVNNVETFFELLYLFTKDSYIWSYDDFTKYINNKDKLGLNLDIVYTNKRNKVYILKIHDYNTMKELGAQTSWCISKYESSWDEYCNNENNQYIFYDFKQPENHIKSMFGFTLNEKNSYMLHAHDFCNRKSILYFKDKDMAYEGETNFDLEAILNENDITLGNLFGIKNELNFEWNYVSMRDYLEKCSFPLFTMKYNEEKNTCLIKIIRNCNYNYNIEKFAKDLPIFNKYLYEVMYYDEYDYTTLGYLVFDFNKPFTDNMSVVCLYCYNDGKVNDLIFYGAHDINGKHLSIKAREYLYEKGLYSMYMSIESPANKLFQHILYNEEEEANKLINNTSPSEFHQVECGVCTSYDSIFEILVRKKYFSVIKSLVKTGAYINMQDTPSNVVEYIFSAYYRFEQQECYAYFKEMSSLLTMICNDVFKRGMFKDVNDIFNRMIMKDEGLMYVALSNDNYFDYAFCNRHNGYNRYFFSNDVLINTFTKLLMCDSESINKWLDIDKKLGKSTINVTPSVVMVYEAKMAIFDKLKHESQELFNKIGDIILKGKEKLIKENPSLKEMMEHNLEKFIEANNHSPKTSCNDNNCKEVSI